MRENRLYGSEGGEVVSLPYPYRLQGCSGFEPSMESGFRHPCRNECAREGISSTWCKSMSREAINLVAEGNCVAARRGGGATRGERPVRRITNPIRRGVAASLLIYGEA